MTTSTDKRELPDLPEQFKDKKKKSKGPIRFEAIGTILILGGLSYGYTHFLFDSHLKSAAQWGITKVHGAEVNISGIKTSFIKGTFKLSGLQITNKEKPEENILQIGEIRFGFLWDALLRAKFVVNDASIENIQVNVPRKKPGKILPVEEVAHKKITDNKHVKEFEQAVIAEGLKRYSGNALGDIAAILGGKDPSKQVGEIRGELASEKKINSLISELENKEKEWGDKLASISDKKEIEAISNKAKNYKFNSKDPIKSSKELSAIVKEAKQKANEIKTTANQLEADVKKYSQEISQVDNMIEADISSVMKRMNIPEIDVADMSKEIFAGMFLKKLGDYKKYVDMAREYAPPKKTEEEKKQEEAQKITPQERKSGKNYYFPKKKGYPFFWLQKSVISSKPSTSEYSGEIRGELTNVTNQPVLLGKPAQLTFSGNFPHQNIEGVNGKVIIDRTTDKPLDQVKLTIDRFPVNNQKFSSSSELKMELAEAKGSSDFSMVIAGSNVDINLLNSFKQPKYNIDSKSKEVKEILTNVVNGISMISLNASAKGASWGDLDWDISSNFGKELAQGVKREVKNKIEAAKKKIEDQVKGRIKAQKDKLKGKYAAVKSKFDKLINEKKAEVDKVKNQIESEVKGKESAAKNSAKKKVESKGKDALKKLKKKFKF